MVTFTAFSVSPSANETSWFTATKSTRGPLDFAPVKAPVPSAVVMRTLAAPVPELRFTTSCSVLFVSGADSSVSVSDCPAAGSMVKTLSSFWIVPIPCASAMVAPVGLLRFTKNVSSFSSVASAVRSMTTSWLVGPPGSKFSVPVCAT